MIKLSAGSDIVDAFSFSCLQLAEKMSEIDNFLAEAVAAIAKDKNIAAEDVSLGWMGQWRFERDERRYFDAFLQCNRSEIEELKAMLHWRYGLVKNHFFHTSRRHLQIFAYALLKCRYTFGDEYFKLLELASEDMDSMQRKVLAMEAAKNIYLIDVLRWLNYQLEQGYIRSNDNDGLKAEIRKALKEIDRSRGRSVKQMYRMSYNAIATYAGVSDTGKIIRTILTALLLIGFCLTSNPDWIGLQVLVSAIVYGFVVAGIWNDYRILPGVRKKVWS